MVGSWHPALRTGGLTDLAKQVLTEDFNAINSLYLEDLFEIKTNVFEILRGAHGEMDLSGKVGSSTRFLQESFTTKIYVCN